MHRILVIGDDRQTSRTIRWVLEYKGHQVMSAFRPEAVIEALVKKNYDLVIAKLSQGSGDNLRVLSTAKQLNPETKVVLMSDNSRILPWEAYCLEVDDYLLMPISPNELWRRVSRCLESRPNLRLRASRKAKVSSQTMKAGHCVQETFG